MGDRIMQIIKFDAVSLMLNPFVLMFVTIALGLLFGKVKFGMFSFGTSGALFVGLIVGWAIYGFSQKIYDAGDETAAGLVCFHTIVYCDRFLYGCAFLYSRRHIA